jgi:hypothetical protein
MAEDNTIDLNLPSSITGESEPAYPGARDFVGEAEESQATLEALGVLEQSIGGGDSLQFPANLGVRKVVFKVKPRNRPTTTTRTKVAPKSIIGLPIPANLQTGYGAQYSQTGLGVLGNNAQDFFGDPKNLQAISQGQYGDAFTSYIGQEGFTNTLKQAGLAIAASASPEVAALIGGAIADKIPGLPATVGLGVGAAAGNAVRGALSGAGIAVNPHMAMLFEGVGFRQHSFQYKFSPRNSSESTSVKKIIKVFKKAMLPSIDEGKLAFFNYPEEFDIEFPNDNGFLFKIGTSVLTDFQINYTPDGGSYFHQNGAPVSVQMSLAFTEVDILTKKEIDGGR